MCNHPNPGGVLGSVCTECPAALASDLVSGFPTLVAHHRDLVYGVAHRWSRSVEDAEDLTQEAFLRAYKALLGYSPERMRELRLRGWLARITLNLARNRARVRDPVAVDLDAVAEPLDEREIGPASIVEQRESRQIWRRLLATLPANQRVAVELRHVEGLSYPEIAEALAKPAGTVKSDVHRGVKRLRRAYESDQARVAALGPPSITRLSSVSQQADRRPPTGMDQKVMAR